jgi:outer membrane cobalamin receptor
MKRYYIHTLLLIITLFDLSYSQSGSIKGKVIDSAKKESVQFADVIIYSEPDSVQVAGAVTNSEGIFELTKIGAGKYYIDIQFIGYEKKRLKGITISSNNVKVDLGEIPIQSTTINLGDVVVEGEQFPITYQTDKKVIDVDKMPTVLSGTAADVLENVPSITVDIEGNVSLRGSTDFTVFVDGRPSVLDAQDALQQIPAGTIDDIEIITNPSAKYRAEGTSGIINIILKKTKNVGLNGLTNLNAGLNEKYSGNFLFEYKDSWFNSNMGLDYNHMFFPGDNRHENRTTIDNTTTYLNTNGNIKWGRINYGLRGGMEFKLSQHDLLNIGGRYGHREFQRSANLNYDEWSDVDNQHFFYKNDSYRERSGYFYALHTNYVHKFEQEDHEISSELFFSYRDGDEISLTKLFDRNILSDGKYTTESGPSKDFRGKIDYTLPLRTNSKFESGYQGEIDLSNEATGISDLDSSSGSFFLLPEFSHNTEYNESEHAFYTIYSDEIDNLGFQGGLRTEYTFRSIKVDEINEFKIDRWDYFPSAHLSYKFPDGQQIIASYSRRIQRPRGWSLEPFDTWIDANNINRGNPSLKPMYIDSYEMGYRTFFGKVSLSSELYYRVNRNKIERIRSAYAENITLNTFDNVGKDYSFGTELMLTFGIRKVWDINLMGNLYNYRINGTINNESFSRESFNWSSRFNNSINISESTQLQVNASYNSPTVSSQGRVEGSFSTDVAVKHELFNKSLVLTIQIRDLLQTAKHEFTTTGIDFYSYGYSKRESPVIILNVRYNINNHKEERDREQPENGFGGDMEF